MINQLIQAFANRLGIVETNAVIRYEVRTLPANVTVGTIDIAALRFNNLEIGKTYRLTISPQAIHSANTNIMLRAVHDSISILNVQVQPDNGGPSDRFAMGRTLPAFVATDTFVQFDLAISGVGGQLEGNSTTFQTYVALEELPNHVPTTQWV